MGILGAVTGALGGVVGNIINNNAAKDAANKAWDRQKNVMMNQVQWRVRDAVAAGLHPLAAIGMNPASGPAPAMIDGSLGPTLANAGQDLGNSIERAMQPEDRTASALTRLQLERGTLENDLLRAQLTSQRLRNIREASPAPRVTNGKGVPEGGYTHPDGSWKSGDNGMGSKAVVDGYSKPFIVSHPGAAQQIADNYGDAAQEIYGLGSLAVDLVKNYGPDVMQYLGDVMKSAATSADMSADNYDALGNRW